MKTTKSIVMTKGGGIAEDGLYKFVASTEDVDRDGDIVKQNWLLDNYRKNPVILFAHDNGSMPVAKTESITVIQDDNPRLEIDIRFAETEMAQELKRLVDGGFLNAVSVGFRVLEYEDPTEQYRQEKGMGPWGIIISKSELLETSLVPIPSNYNALRRAFDKELITEKTYNLLTKTDSREMEVPKAVLDSLNEIKAAISQLTDKVSSLEGIPGSPAIAKSETIEDSNFYGDLMEQVWDKLCNPTIGENNNV